MSNQEPAAMHDGHGEDNLSALEIPVYKVGESCRHCCLIRGLLMMMGSMELMSMISVIGTFGITGVALFIWMAASNWADKTGVIIGVIFILLSVLQCGATVGWWILTRKERRLSGDEAEPHDVSFTKDNNDFKDKEMVQLNKNQSSNVNGADSKKQKTTKNAEISDVKIPLTGAAEC